jgi:hypothetical protein
MSAIVANDAIATFSFGTDLTVPAMLALCQLVNRHRPVGKDALLPHELAKACGKKLVCPHDGTNFIITGEAIYTVAHECLYVLTPVNAGLRRFNGVDRDNLIEAIYAYLAKLV